MIALAKTWVLVSIQFHYSHILIRPTCARDDPIVLEDPMDGWEALLGSVHGYQELAPLREGRVLISFVYGGICLLSQHSPAFAPRSLQ